MAGQIPGDLFGVVDRVLRVSTRHMPDLHQDLSPWDWGAYAPSGNPSNWEMLWFWAYEEDPQTPEQMPDWLLQICITARDKYGCNWIVLDPYADALPDFPVYDN